MKEIPLTKGRVAIVDDEDFERLTAVKWKLNNCGYAVRNLPRNGGPRGQQMLHRAVLGLAKGDPMQVDHVNGDKLDNRRANLRLCTPQQNALNRPATARSKSGVKGVCRAPASDLWRASICANGKRHYLGRFTTIDEARAAYNRAALQLHGEFANTGEQQ